MTKVDKSGTTAVVALLIGKVLCMANIGDSECVLATQNSDGTFQVYCLSCARNQ